MPPERVVRVALATDGKRGHENQSRVVARMLGDREPLILQLRPGINELPLRLRFALTGRGWLKRPAAAELTRRLMKPENPETFRAFAEDMARERGAMRLFSVSTGTPPATCNLVLAAMLGAQPVVNMTPSLLPRKLFALNIVPEHDLQNVTALSANIAPALLALGYHDAAAAQHLAGRICAEQGLDPAGRYLGLAIGGPSKSVNWDGAHVAAQLAQLCAWARQAGWRILATTSRRTPPQLAASLAQQSGPEGAVAYLLDAARDPLNPLPAFYELCQAIAVSADSFSMACEAVHAGHCPVLLTTAPAPKPGKLARSLDLLAARGLSATPEALLAGRLPARGTPNMHYEELARGVRERLGLDKQDHS